MINREPETCHFSPRGKAGRPGYINLTLDEYETVRYADHMRLTQRQAAKSMGISQQTFSRVLARARRKIAEGLVLSRIIKISGGSYKVGNNAYA